MAKPAEKRQKGAPKGDKTTAVNFQAFRPTFATWMQKTGATVKDVQGAMRHSTPDQTLKVYTREIPGGVRTAVEDLDHLLNEKRGLAEAKAEGGVQWAASSAHPARPNAIAAFCKQLHTSLMPGFRLLVV